MSRIPEFFQPKIERDGNYLKWHDIAWDKNGREVRMSLGCALTGAEEADAIIDVEAHWRKLMRAAAWQAVWEQAQKEFKPIIEGEIYDNHNQSHIA